MQDDTVKKDIYTSFYLGYAGSAKLFFDESGNYVNSEHPLPDKGWTFLSLTNAVYTRKLNIPKTTSFYLPYSNSTSDAKSQIRLGFGVFDFNGSITFELTDKIIDAIWKQSFFSRKGLFHLILNDGMNELTIPNCCWSNINIDASPHSIISMNISFMSDNGKSNSLIITDVQNDNNQDTYNKLQDDLVRYWETGVTQLGTLESFNLTFSRSVNPVYHNNKLYTPTYLKAGRTDIIASFTCTDYYGDDKFDYDKQAESDNGDDGGVKIWISERHYVKFKQNVFSSQTYNISGLSQAGTKVYEINSLSQKITDNIFTIGTQGGGA